MRSLSECVYILEEELKSFAFNKTIRCSFYLINMETCSNSKISGRHLCLRKTVLNSVQTAEHWKLSGHSGGCNGEEILRDDVPEGLIRFLVLGDKTPCT